MKKISIYTLTAVIFYSIQAYSIADEDSAQTQFTDNGSKILLIVSGNWGFFCKKGPDSVSYVVHNGSHEHYCALGYTYTRCQTEIKNDHCPKRSTITDNKLLYSTRDISNKKACLEKAKKLAEKIKKMGFECQESGIN